MKSVGLFVDDDRVVMAQLKKGLRGSVSLEAYREISLHEVPGEDRESIVVSNIEGFIDENGGKAANVFLGVPRRKVLFRYVSLPEAVESNLRTVLGYEMDRYTPYAEEKVYFDFKILDRDPASHLLKVLLIVIQRDLFDYYLGLLEKAHVQPFGMEATATVLFNLVSKDSGKGKRPFGGGLAQVSVLNSIQVLLRKVRRREGAPVNGDGLNPVEMVPVIDIEKNSFEMDIIRDGVLEFSREVHISDTASNGGSPPSHVESIVSELSHAVLGLERDLREPKIPEVILTGSGVEEDVVSSLREKSGMPVSVLTDVGIRMAPHGDGGKASSLSFALGLALKGLRGVPLDINLIPLPMRPKKKRSIGLIAGIVLLVGLGVAAVGFAVTSLVQERLYLSGLEAKIERLREEVAAVEEMQAQAEKIEGQAKKIDAIKAKDVSKLDLLREMSEIIPLDVWLTRLDYKEKDGQNIVELSGFATRAAEIIPILEKSPLFEGARFTSPITKGRSVKERFKIEAKVLPRGQK
jgi:general secretion pathway protein L